MAPSPTDRGEFPATNIAGEPVEVKTSSDEPTSALVFKTISDPFTGKVSLIRVVSGTITPDSHLWNAREDVELWMPHVRGTDAVALEPRRLEGQDREREVDRRAIAADAPRSPCPVLRRRVVHDRDVVAARDVSEGDVEGR